MSADRPEKPGIWFWLLIAAGVVLALLITVLVTCALKPNPEGGQGPSSVVPARAAGIEWR